MFGNLLPSLQNLAVDEVMWKNTLEPDSPPCQHNAGYALCILGN